MRSTLVHLVAVFLLLAQGLVGAAPGRVLCLPVSECGTHGVGTSTEHSHSHTACGSTTEDRPGAGRCDGHEHCLIELTLHEHEGCGCHVHLPAPAGDRAAPGAHPRGDRVEIRALAVHLAAVLIATERDLASRPTPGFRPPDFSVCAQTLALKATRLLI